MYLKNQENRTHSENRHAFNIKKFNEDCKQRRKKFDLEDRCKKLSEDAVTYLVTKIISNEEIEVLWHSKKRKCQNQLEECNP